MSKKKRRNRQPPPDRKPPSAARRRRTRRLLVTAGVVVTLAVAAIVVRWVAHSTPAAAIPLPPPARSTPPSAQPTFVDFVGAETCEGCHAEQYAAWKGSTHGRAGGPPTPDRVIAPFNGAPIRFKDAVVTPSAAAGGEYTFTVAQKGRPVRVYRVDAVVGGGFLAGGGTQAFFSKFPDGTLRFLPFDYSKPVGRWFCNTAGRANRDWIPITPEIALADCADWMPYRVLGDSERSFNCEQCHGSQIEVGFDTAARRYQTRFTTLAINCESCHGPGRRHVELARSGRIGTEVDIGMRPLATLTKDESLGVCLQCHALKTPLRGGYLPGKRLEEHYALKLPLILEPHYFPDGRTRTFAYQEGHLSSDCYLNGSMTCVDCHDPHTQRYRNVNGAALAGRLDNGQCLGCHPSKEQPLERHTHHPPTSPGSRCVACHMPYLQQPDVGRQIPYARSDHTISIPRPLFDTGQGHDTACRQCHRDQAAELLQSQVTKWYGELKPHPEPVRAALAADSKAEPQSAARRILTTRGKHPLAEFLGLTYVLQRSAAEGPELDHAMIERLEQHARSADPEVQSLALATLHLTRGDDPTVRRFLSERLRVLGPRDGPVRDRWAWILKSRGTSYLNAGDRRAIQAYERADEVRPDDPSMVKWLGLAYLRLGEYDRAIDHLRRSLERAPGEAQVELGIALMQRGDIEGATAAFRGAAAANPWDSNAWGNLGVALLRRGDVQSSIDALEKAVSMDPGVADANFMLANAYARLGRLKQAEDALERGLEFAPRDTEARRMLDEIRRAAGPTVK